jgi:hypothetical protein
VILYNLKPSHPVESHFRREATEAVRIALSHDGRYVAIGVTPASKKANVEIWDAAMRHRLWVLPVAGHRIDGIDWSPDNRTLAACLDQTENPPGTDVILWQFTDEQLADP